MMEFGDTQITEAWAAKVFRDPLSQQTGQFLTLKKFTHASVRARAHTQEELGGGMRTELNSFKPRGTKRG